MREALRSPIAGAESLRAAGALGASALRSPAASGADEILLTVRSAQWLRDHPGIAAGAMRPYQAVVDIAIVDLAICDVDLGLR